MSAFTATLNATNTLSFGFGAANAARNTQQRAQIAASADAAQARREPMFAAPPASRPMLPPHLPASFAAPPTAAPRRSRSRGRTSRPSRCPA